MSPTPIDPPGRAVAVTIDGRRTTVAPDATVLDACRANGVDVPTLCYAANLTPVNVCRVCVVEVEGSRALVPSCSRLVDDGMVVSTDSERVRISRRMVFELLASASDLSRADDDIHRWMTHYEVDVERHGDPAHIATLAQPPKVEDDLYVRDYDKCILCYKCVEACGDDAQRTYAIAVAGRGFDAHIATEHEVVLPDSACVYCGNCIGVCPTGALVFKTEHDHREAGTWRPDDQSVTRTVCSYCGVGCNLELHVQDNQVVKVTSPDDHDVSSGHLCIKGRFGTGRAKPVEQP